MRRPVPWLALAVVLASATEAALVGLVLGDPVLAARLVTEAGPVEGLRVALLLAAAALGAARRVAPADPLEESPEPPGTLALALAMAARAGAP